MKCLDQVLNTCYRDTSPDAGSRRGATEFGDGTNNFVTKSNGRLQHTSCTFMVENMGVGMTKAGVFDAEKGL
jgi:hypothetical protein